MCLVFLLGPGMPWAPWPCSPGKRSSTFCSLLPLPFQQHPCLTPIPRYHRSRNWPRHRRHARHVARIEWNWMELNGIEWNQAKRLPRPLLAWSSLISDHWTSWEEKVNATEMRNIWNFVKQKDFNRFNQADGWKMFKVVCSPQAEPKTQRVCDWSAWPEMEALWGAKFGWREWQLGPQGKSPKGVPSRLEPGWTKSAFTNITWITTLPWNLSLNHLNPFLGSDIQHDFKWLMSSSDSSDSKIFYGWKSSPIELVPAVPRVFITRPLFSFHQRYTAWRRDGETWQVAWRHDEDMKTWWTYRGSIGLTWSYLNSLKQNNQWK